MEKRKKREKKHTILGIALLVLLAFSGMFTAIKASGILKIFERKTITTDQVTELVLVDDITPTSTPSATPSAPVPTTAGKATPPASPKVTTKNDIEVLIAVLSHNRRDYEDKIPENFPLESIIAFNEAQSNKIYQKVPKVIDPTTVDYDYQVHAIIRNNGPEPVFNVRYEAYYDDLLIGTVTKDRIDQGTMHSMRFGIVPTHDVGRHTITVKGILDKNIPENNYSNNQYVLNFEVVER